jgi:formate dehydrogenase subunit delta
MEAAQHGEVANLARMANQIASFFHAYPDETALQGVRDHIHAFWTRKMQAELAAHAGELALDPLVVRVLPGLERE